VIRVVLADDHNLVRAGIRALLESDGNIDVVGEAADGHAALDLIARDRPDLAFLDITMPGLNGLEVAARIAKSSPRTRLVMLSMHADEAFVARALHAGAVGYVLKDAVAEELPLLVKAVMRGDTYLSPGVSRRLVDALRAAGAAGNGTADTPLTTRQREILQLVAEGRSSKQIAQALGLSTKTVETHRSEIMKRLDIHDLPGLVRYAVRTGIVSADG